MTVSLKKLTKRRPTREELLELNRKLSKLDDHAASIVAATLVETALEDCILSKLRPLSAVERAELFDGDGPIATFAAKVKLGYALSLYGPPARDDLMRIKNIRNAFAHARTLITFDTPEIATTCTQLNVFATLNKADFDIPADQPWPPVEPRQRYLVHAKLFAVVFEDTSTRSVNAPLPPK